jgi:hypothetical protein
MQKGGLKMNEFTLFEQSNLTLEDKLKNFPVFVRRQDISRFLALYELFKIIKNIEGCIIDCGVNLGFSLFTFAKLSANLEIIGGLKRKIIGFDTFEGFPNVSNKDGEHIDMNLFRHHGINVYDELRNAINVYDNNCFLNQFPKIKLIKGDATKTIPEFLKNNPYIIVSLLFIDFDLYEPTKVALEHFLPRIPKGGILAFDEINSEYWVGETLALIEKAGSLNSLKIRKFDFDPNISYV